MVVGEFVIKSVPELCLYQVTKDDKQAEDVQGMFTSYSSARSAIENYLHNYKPEPVKSSKKKEVTEGGEATT